MWQQRPQLGEETLPFMKLDKEDNSKRRNSETSKIKTCPTFNHAVSLQIVLVLLYVTFSFRYFTNSHHQSDRRPLFSHALANAPHHFLLAEESHFAGPPSTLLDHAWSQLLEGTNMRFSFEELEERNQTSIALPDEQGHLAWLESYHQLHCVVREPGFYASYIIATVKYPANESAQKWLRQWTYRDYYHPDLTEEDVRHWLLHADHCFELLRQAVMCKADSALMTFEWQANETKPMLKLEGPTHECINWDDLKARTSHRIVDGAEMERLKNPLR